MKTIKWGALLFGLASSAFASTHWTEIDPARNSISGRASKERPADLVEINAFVMEHPVAGKPSLNFNGSFKRNDNNTPLSLCEIMGECIGFGGPILSQSTYLYRWLYNMCQIMESNINVEFKIKHGNNNYTPFGRVISANQDGGVTWTSLA